MEQLLKYIYISVLGLTHFSSALVYMNHIYLLANSLTAQTQNDTGYLTYNIKCIKSQMQMYICILACTYIFTDLHKFLHKHDLHTFSHT